MGLRLLIALLPLLALATAGAASAQASSGPCHADADAPRCTFWSGRVTFIADGDTIDVAIAGDRTDVSRPIRITGINAMELRRYSKYPARRRGECHAVAATARLEQLLRRGHLRVRLAAQDPASRSGHRLRRQVSVRIGGRWVDVARTLVAEGHALWLPNPVEWAWNAEYASLAKRAAAAGRRLWDAQGCGRGPSAGADLGMRLNFDADGNDGANVNGEWARIANPSGAPVALGGWWFRDSALRRYVFPAGTAIPPGGAVTLRMGGGTDNGGELHWGLTAPPLDNPSFDARAIGDGGYLFDPRGNLRAWVIYP